MKAGRKLVMMLAGGGLTHVSGGVGTFIRYLTDEWAAKPGTPQVRVVDTRGEGGKASMVLHFLGRWFCCCAGAPSAALICCIST